MAKHNGMIDIQLDDEICALVTRIGTLTKPKTHITEYIVTRKVGEPIFVTVTFVADELFSKLAVPTPNDDTPHGCESPACDIHGHTP